MTSPLLSSEEAAAGVRAPVPYFRFWLSSGSRLPPQLPVAMERQNVPMECWDEFWSRIEPVARRANRCAKLSQATLFVALISFTGFTVYLASQKGPPYLPYLSVLALIVTLMIISFLVGRTKNAQLEEIRTLCIEDERKVFRSYGYDLECEYELSWNNGSGLCLYFIPVATKDVADDPNSIFRSGHLRIKVLDGSPDTCRWNVVRMTTLARYDFLPNDFEFWSKMTEASLAYKSTYRFYLVMQWSLLAFFTR